MGWIIHIYKDIDERIHVTLGRITFRTVGVLTKCPELHNASFSQLTSHRDVRITGYRVTMHDPDYLVTGICTTAAEHDPLIT